MIIEIFQSPKNKNYFFRIKARNGRIIAQSEGYKRKRDIKKLLWETDSTDYTNVFAFKKVKDLTK